MLMSMSVQRPVQTQRNEERVQQRDQDGEDDRGRAVEPGEPGAKTGTHPHAEGADEEGGERDHDDHREERHEDHLMFSGKTRFQNL